MIRQTVTTWSDYTGEKFSDENARQILENISGFFQLLCEWDEADKKNSKGFDSSGRS